MEVFLIYFISLIFLILAAVSVPFKIAVLQVIVMLLEEVKGLYAVFSILCHVHLLKGQQKLKSPYITVCGYIIYN